MAMKRREFLTTTTAGAVSASGWLLSHAAFGAEVFGQQAGPQRIPITMSHGINRTPRPPSNSGFKSLSAVQFDALYRIPQELGFETIGYDDLERWRNGTGTLPRRPIMIDFDHPTITMRFEVNDIMQRYGFRPTLFVNTAGIEAQANGTSAKLDERQFMTWDEVGELVKAGWYIGSHTVNHPNLSELSQQDPTGARLAEELDQNNATIERRLGIKSRDFAYTGTSFSTQAEREVKKRYRFGRLWIVRSMYNVDGKEARYADVVGVPGADEADGGPPKAARYITRRSNPYRLPSMDTNYLIHSPEAFRRYLEEALTV